MRMAVEKGRKSDHKRSRLYRKRKGGEPVLISSRGQYAIRILLDLALHENGDAINVKTIAQRQELSEKYMEQILSVLQKAGFVVSTRGYHGGYHLAGKPESYSVGKILRTVDGPLIPANQQSENGNKPIDLVVNELWVNLQDKIEQTHGRVAAGNTGIDWTYTPC